MVNDGESNGRGNNSICQRYLFYNDCVLPGLGLHAVDKVIVVFHHPKYWFISLFNLGIKCVCVHCIWPFVQTFDSSCIAFNS